MYKYYHNLVFILPCGNLPNGGLIRIQEAPYLPLDITRNIYTTGQSAWLMENYEISTILYR